MIPIVFSTDHNFIIQTGVCIYSLLEAAEDCCYDINVIVDDSVTESDKEQLRNQVSKFSNHKISFINAGNEFEGWFEIRGISIAAYYRLLIPWLLPQYDKVIYSDVDIIFRLSLRSVYDIDLTDNYCAAVRASSFRFCNELANYARKLGLDPINYFNSGFLVINSKKQREDNLKNEILNFESIKLTYQDQDIINILCKDHIIPISQKFNITPAFYKHCISKDIDIYEYYGNQYEIADYLRGNNCIIHYAGAKPWNTFVFAFSEWWTTYQKSIFFDPSFFLDRYNNIINPKISLRRILGQIKRYIKNSNLIKH